MKKLTGRSGGLSLVDVLPDNNLITGSEREFCLEYYETGNAAMAARAIGITTTNPAQHGLKLLKMDRIKNYIKAIAQVHEEYAEFHRNQFVNALRVVVSTNIGDFMDNDWTKLKDMKKVPKEKLHAVKEVNVQEFYDREGNHIKTNTTIKLVDKIKYMEILAKLKNYFEDHNTRVTNVQVKIG